jgi:hypothetical protein|tara:strand:+ start:43 stop:306 length:264 start_codon:yes stop_codon:yes gene_type:complete
MKFLMVMIICFAEDTCQAVFDATQFDTYDQCMAQALPVSRYMRDVYATSSGEIHCLSSEETAIYQEYLNNGGKPTLSLEHPDQTSSI